MGDGNERGNYERAEEELEDLKSEIEFEYNAPYDDLTPYQQRGAIIDHFFNGNSKYEGSAEDLRRGINAIRGTQNVEEGKSRFDQITRGGKTYHIVRDATTGRIRQWVRE